MKAKPGLTYRHVMRGLRREYQGELFTQQAYAFIASTPTQSKAAKRATKVKAKKQVNNG